MAEGLSVSENVVCRFFATSKCRDGQKCMFPHDRSRSVLDNVCRFYLQGRCIYGTYCHYDHLRLQPRSRRSDAERQRLALELGATANSNSDGGPDSPDWVHAPEFFPKDSKSLQACAQGAETFQNGLYKCENPEELLCQYFIVGNCPHGDSCPLIHGEVCEMCRKPCLLPFDKEQQKDHIEKCSRKFDRSREETSAMQRSVGQTCGICFDVIMEKHPVSERRFGILEKCNHVFCLTCIRKWRKVKNTENHSFESELDPMVTRTCPECRVPSDFVTPSKYWVESDDDKQKLIRQYKDAMSKKPCNYFKQGRGTCPFAGACFYLHARPDGTKVVLPPPVRRPRVNQEGELLFGGQRVFLWDYLELRDEVMLSFDWDDMFTTDSDDSEQSDMD